MRVPKPIAVPKSINFYIQVGQSHDPLKLSMQHQLPIAGSVIRVIFVNDDVSFAVAMFAHCDGILSVGC